LNIVLLVDQETICPEDPHLAAATPPEQAVMEHHIASGLREAGHDVSVMPFGPDPLATATALREAAPQMVFNLTEWFDGDRRKDAYVASLLGLLRIPYTGAGPIGLTLCRDKALCKRVLSHHRVRLPHFVAWAPGAKKPPGRVVYPAIVKPLLEDGSDGISMASLVYSDAECRERAALIFEQRNQPVICEEYIEGREIYIGVVGNERARVLPAREVKFPRAEEGGPTIATARVKWDEAYRKKWGIEYTAADLDPALAQRAASVSRRVYRHLQLRDYGRIDLRIRPSGEIVFLEANPNPNLARDEDVAESAAQAGIPYPKLLDRIIHLALQRQGKT